MEKFVRGDERLFSIDEPVQLQIVHLRSSTTPGTQDPANLLITEPVTSEK
jgi:hypothetical protein